MTKPLETSRPEAGHSGMIEIGKNTYVMDADSDLTESLMPLKTVTLLEYPDSREIWCPIISVDDHVLEPSSLFADYGASAYRDELPRVVENDHGVPHWVIGSKRVAITMANGVIGRPRAEWAMRAPMRFPDMRRGVWDSKERLHDMDLNGVWSSLCFPSMVWGFAGKAFLWMHDPDASFEAVRAYNRWHLEEWCGADPERYVACQLPWLGDPEKSAQEIRANAEKGFKAVSFSENPEGLGLPSIYSEHWDPFLRACEETGTVINLHVGSSGQTLQPSTESPPDVLVALFALNSIMAVVDWVFARVPLRYPDIKIALSEGGATWVPLALERLGRAHRYRDLPSSGLRPGDPHPADLLRRNFWFASIEDPLAFELLSTIGEDRVMVESDYPHSDSSWPDTQATIRAETEGVLSPPLLRKVCFENAAKLYGLPHPPEDRIATAIGLN